MTPLDAFPTPRVMLSLLLSFLERPKLSLNCFSEKTADRYSSNAAVLYGQWAKWLAYQVTLWANYLVHLTWPIYAAAPSQSVKNDKPAHSDPVRLTHHLGCQGIRSLVSSIEHPISIEILFSEGPQLRNMMLATAAISHSHSGNVCCVVGTPVLRIVISLAVCIWSNNEQNRQHGDHRCS